ncbi:MAG: 50S ribosomal protein L11 methyltransferase [Akkermansia sp.]|nr:50S ribosomal protein L11 methyltransferase [Akkermansia sp.]
MWLWYKTAPHHEESKWQEITADMPGAVISAEFNAQKIRVEVYTETAEEAFVLQACYGGNTQQIKDVDWVAATAPENTPPLLIRDKIVISASDNPDVLDELRRKYPRRIILTFPAEMAFGTGNHATTSTCLRMLCDEVVNRTTPWTLTDIGCGTGVLALAGLRLGAESAVSFDFDPKAVEVAERNIIRNGGADNLKLFQADVFEWKPARGEQSDIVLANLFSTVLQKAFPRILPAMKTGGVLIISGILNTQAEETLAAAEAAGLRTLKVVTRGKWTTAKLTNA